MSALKYKKKCPNCEKLATYKRGKFYNIIKCNNCGYYERKINGGK